MLYYTSTHADVAESFFLGLSCLVGGDQFFILVSKTDASPKTQSYIAMTAVLSTLFLAFVLYDEYNRSLFDITHVLYLVLLVIWGLILYQNVKNPFVTTYYISILGMVMTFLVIISCVHYSHQKELLPSFLSGMLFARLLPTLLWIFVHQKKAESKSNLSSLSARLALFRLVFGIISMILKFTSGNLDFSALNVGIKQNYDWQIIRPYAFMNFAEHFRKLVEHFKKSSDHICSIAYLILLITASLFFFIYSIVSHLGLPPAVHKFSYLYSSHLYSRIDVVKTLSHLLGVAIGTKYPASKTANSYSFAAVCLACFFYFLGLDIVNNSSKFIDPMFLYTVVNLTGFLLGYVWSYSLAIIVNTFLNPTCFYEDISGLTPCCGEKIESLCYCRLESIIDELNKSRVTCDSYGILVRSSKVLLFRIIGLCRYENRFSCSKSYPDVCSNESFNYHHNAPNAILLFYCDDFNNVECCKANCAETCKTLCYCLKIVGIYKIESVTTSTCENCQLTIRIEAKSGCCCKNGSCSGSLSNCVGEDGKCCCLSTKCCEKTSNCCCCVKFCNSNGNPCRFFCKLKPMVNLTRLFICYKTNGDKCCIKEIRPNFIKELIPDLKIQNEFDIKNIFFSDCCHTDLAVIIECSMKNNFFRVSPINYPKKTINPLSLTLMRDGTECCNQPSNKSCCKNNKFVKVCAKYQGSEPDCKIECKCQGGNTCCCNGSGQCGCCTEGKCCCCLTCTLNVNRLTSFYETVEPVRVKVVLILWFFFLIFLMISISRESRYKNKKLKYYQFFPIRSFQTVNKELESNGMNSMHKVLERLRSVQQNIFLQLFGEKDKKTDLDHMFQLCKCSLDPCSLNTLRHYILSKSSMLISSPHYVNRRLNLELVKWSYCVGFVYTYIILMFFRIQQYFFKWEQVWEVEYLNYKRIMTSKFNNLTQKSKSSMSLMCEKSVDHKTILYTDTSKKGGWDSSNDEIDIHANLNERETEMNKDPPYRLDLRLKFYLDKWKHRVENLIFWTENEINIYDWAGLIDEYPKIRTWFFKFFLHIQAASHELDISMEKLDRGTEIVN